MNITYAVKPHKNINKTIFLMMGAFVLISFISDPTWAVTVERLQEPIRELKTEIFGGWMGVLKVFVGATALGLGAIKHSVTPVGVGVGLYAAIELIDRYLGNAAAGALI